MSTDRIAACMWFYRVFRDVATANRLADLAVSYWEGERRG